MPSCDLIHRFLFEDTDIRGEVATLNDSYCQVLANNSHLPEPVQRLLGEFVAAVTLLSGTLKFDGLLTLQARGDGPVPLIMAECSHHKAVRAIARVDEEVDLSAFSGNDLPGLLGSGVLAMIVEPDKGERYQGIVPLEGGRLSDCLESYFTQSEQLPTRFWFACDQQAVSGLMLQVLPRQVASSEKNADHWNTATQLANTVRSEELLQLEHPELLYRLFNEEEVRLFEPSAIRFECSCSRERSANALRSLGRAEVESLLAEQDLINIDCQFCNKSYNFGSLDLKELFDEKINALH